MITVIFLIILAINGSHWDELQPWMTTFKILVGVAVADLLFELYLADQVEKLRLRIVVRENQQSPERQDLSATTE